MDPASIALLVGLIVSLVNAVARAMLMLQGQPLTDEQRETLREQQKRIVDAIGQATPVPVPPGEIGGP